MSEHRLNQMGKVHPYCYKCDGPLILQSTYAQFEGVLIAILPIIGRFEGRNCVCVLCLRCAGSYSSLNEFVFIVVE
jgi:hypothetical protein